MLSFFGRLFLFFSFSWCFLWYTRYIITFFSNYWHVTWPKCCLFNYIFGHLLVYLDSTLLWSWNTLGDWTLTPKVFFDSIPSLFAWIWTNIWINFESQFSQFGNLIMLLFLKCILLVKAVTQQLDLPINVIIINWQLITLGIDGLNHCMYIVLVFLGLFKWLE